MAGSSCARIGRWFTLGDPDRFQVKLRMSPIEIPTAWVAAVCALALLNLIARHFAGLSGVGRIALVFLEMMLVLRLAVAFEAASIDSRSEAAVAIDWLALLWLPLAFEFVPSAAGRVSRWVIALPVKLTLVVGGSWVVMQTGHLSAEELLKVFVVLGALAAAIAVCTWARAPLVRLIQRVAPRINTMPWAAAPVLVISCVHFLILALSHSQEQVFGIRASALVIPMLVLSWAHLFAVLDRSNPNLTYGNMFLALAVTIGPYGVFLSAGDMGSIIYFIPVSIWMARGALGSSSFEWLQWTVAFGVALALGLIALALYVAPFRSLLMPGLIALVPVAVMLAVLLFRSRPAPQALWSVPLLCVSAAFLTVDVASWIKLAQRSTEAASSEITVQHLEEVVRTGKSAIRFMQVIAPDEIERLGIREGYEERADLQDMYNYSATLSGRGWLQANAPTTLLRTHVDDTVTAVHLLSPFGRVGGFCVLLFLLAFCGAILSFSVGDHSRAACASQLAAMVLTVISLYMLLANMGIVPFTGRNFYFLAAGSRSDLLEGGLLLALVMGARK